MRLFPRRVREYTLKSHQHDCPNTSWTRTATADTLKWMEGSLLGLHSTPKTTKQLMNAESSRKSFPGTSTPTAHLIPNNQPWKQIHTRSQNFQVTLSFFLSFHYFSCVCLLKQKQNGSYSVSLSYLSSHRNMLPALFGPLFKRWLYKYTARQIS